MTIQQLFKQHGEFILVIDGREQHVIVNNLCEAQGIPVATHPNYYSTDIKLGYHIETGIDGSLEIHHSRMAYYNSIEIYNRLPRVPATALFPPLYKRHT